MSKINLPRIPTDWHYSKFTEIGQLIRGVSYKKIESSKEPQENLYPILRANNIQDNKIIFEDFVYVPKDKINDEQFIKPFDIIIAMSSGSKHLVGKTAQILREFTGSFGTFCGLLRINKDINQKLIGFFFQSPYYRNTVSNLSKGVNINNLKRDHIENLIIPIPPLNIRNQIVEKIEELFSKLDFGVINLKKIKAQLIPYRQSVLVHAFEGEFTKDWREKKNSNKKIVELNSSDLPERPEGWKYLPLEKVISKKKNSMRRGPFGSDIKKAFFVETGYKVYEQGNVINKDFNRGNYYIDEEKFNELKNLEIKPDDILITCAGTIGQVAIVPKNIERGIINQALLKLTLDRNKIINKFFIHFFDLKRSELMSTGTRGTSMKNLASVRVLKKMKIPIPPILEQQKIVEEIERNFSISNNAEKIINDLIEKANKLRQSILNRAFEGKLINQENDTIIIDKLSNKVNQIRNNEDTSTNIRKNKDKNNRLKQTNLRDYVKKK
ncbi:MAG: restriction endonuclease subunit S [Candidatus Hodarchaeota archaeon]